MKGGRRRAGLRSATLRFRLPLKKVDHNMSAHCESGIRLSQLEEEVLGKRSFCQSPDTKDKLLGSHDLCGNAFHSPFHWESNRHWTSIQTMQRVASALLYLSTSLKSGGKRWIGILLHLRSRSQGPAGSLPKKVDNLVTLNSHRVNNFLFSRTLREYTMPRIAKPNTGWLSMS